MSFNSKNNSNNLQESSSTGHQGEMTPDKSSLQGKCLSGTISTEVKVENCLLCPSHMTVLFRKMPLTVPQVALSTMGVSKMSTMFTGQGLRLGCAMGEVGGQQGIWS